jgi:glycosyltransferase involved in cell wall biosynthesis
MATPNALSRLVKRALPQVLFECAAAGYNLPEHLQAMRLMRSGRPDLVYARHALNDIGVLGAARDAHVPTVLEVNTLYSSDAYQVFEPLVLRRVARALERKALRLASLVVTVSTPLAGLVQALAPGVRTLTVPNGANPEQFEPSVDGTAIRRQYGIEAGCMVVGWSGALRAWHGLELLIEAVAQRPEVVLLVIGDGPDRPRVEAQVRRLGVGARVRFAGRVPRDRMAEHLAAIDIGVVADDLTRYASPMKLVEYMAMGKAVVAPDLANIRDVVTDGSDGLLFRPGDAGSLGAQLARLADAGCREGLGRAGRAKVVTERNWTEVARSILGASVLAVAEREA